MPLTVRQIVAPQSEPLSLDEIQEHLRIDTVDDVDLLGIFIAMARSEVEKLTRRQLLTATWELFCDWFPSEIRLPYPPIQSVSQIEYLDTAGVLQVLDASLYQTDLISEPARIRRAPNQSWPSTQAAALNSVKITYVAGALTADAVEPLLVLAMRLIVGDLYEHREAEIDIEGPLKAIQRNKTLDRILRLQKVWYPDFIGAP